MGSIKEILIKKKLPEREKHHSRMFIDLAENIHIHYREYRFIFSLPEFLEFSDILEKSVYDVKNYLEQNKDYTEKTYPTTLIVAGGKERQLKFLENSPVSNQSFYLNDEFTIELQDEFVTDEIHIHYRDFRLGIDRTRFRILAEGFKLAIDNLNKFETKNTYVRKSHSDRLINNYNNNNSENLNSFPYIKNISIENIKSYNYPEFPKGWRGNKSYLTELESKFKLKKNTIAPLILTKKKQDYYYIIDGHHRLSIYKKLGYDKADCIITDLTFEESANLRKAESLLKDFDSETLNKYSMTEFYKSYLGQKLNNYYSGHFKKKIFRNNKIFQILRKIKRFFFGKELVFKNFFESHNKKK